MADPRDSVEVFHPDYTARARLRPNPTDVPPEIHYQTATSWNDFSLEVDKAPLMKHAVLIGAGAVTHHFDYGQRYVKLPFRADAPRDLSVLPPPRDTLAPPGYYLLFVVDDAGRPSEGWPVRLDY